MLKFLRKLFAKKPVASLSSRQPPEGYGTATEFMAEVVVITKLYPHSNADKLEFARFATRDGDTAYQCIVQKGQFTIGQFAGYFSVDCIVPTDKAVFRFLLDRIDGAGKANYRLRAARLRGSFSQGLLVSLGSDDTYKLGDFLGTEFGVTYYQGRLTVENGPTAKSGTPKAQPMPQYGVDSLKKLPNLFAEGEPVHITEKIHGTNFRFGWVRKKLFGIPFGWRFVVGSHRAMKGGDTRGTHFYKEDLWTEAAKDYELAKRTQAYKGHIFYGELYGYTKGGSRIQDLVYGRSPGAGPGLAIFDVLSPHGWFQPDERHSLLRELQLPGVPVLSDEEPTPPEGFAHWAEGKSTLDSRQVREGVVVESLKPPRRKAKYVGEGYLMRKTED